MTEPLNGKHFRARVRLSTKDDETLAEAGETCERVPVASLPGLLASERIEPIDAAWTDLGRPADDKEQG
jgi:hypothetical protein